MLTNSISKICQRKGRLSAYLRLIRADKPIGTWLLLLPCWWGHGMGFAMGGGVPVHLMGMFAGGALCMRSAGCIINDMWDREFDKQVERTKLRPIAAGEISLPTAFSYLTAHMTVGLSVLLSLHQSAVLIGAMSVPLIVIYPLCKRVTYLPQLFLGLTFNWGILVAYASVLHAISWPVIAPLYAAGISWTLLYDTVYAHQDKKDDVGAGVKSSALFFGDSKTPLHGFNGLTTGLLSISGYMAGLHPIFYPCAAVSGVMLSRTLRSTNLQSPKDCGKFFRANKWYGLAITAGIFLGGWLKEEEEEEDNDDNVKAPQQGGKLYWRENVELVRRVVGV